MTDPARPDYVACVLHTVVGPPRTWCGRSLEVATEFTFMSIDHAAYHGVNGGRLVPCPECLAAVAKALGLAPPPNPSGGRP